MEAQAVRIQPPLNRPMRWKLLIFGLLTIGAIHTGSWMAAPGLTYKVMFAWGTVLGGASFIVAWWCLFCGLPWRIRLQGVVAVAVLIAVVLAVVRIDKIEYYGHMIPRVEWSFRWNPSRLERVADYFESEEVVALPIPNSVTVPPLAGQTRPDTVATATSIETDEKSTSKSTEKTLDTSAVQTSTKPQAKPRSKETPKTGANAPIALYSKGDWPEFRGPNRDGIVKHTSIRTDWDALPPRQLWKHPVGEGWSSFAIVGERAYTQEQRSEFECVICYEAASGKRVWIHEDQVRFDEALGGPGPRATPTVHGDCVFTMGATGLLNCLDAFTGKRIWVRNVLDDSQTKNLQWAMSGSPLLVDDLVIVSPGKGIAAYERLSGTIRWTSGEYPSSYASPRLEVINRQPQVLLFHGDGLASHDTKSGNKLWGSPTWSNSPKINVAQPIVRDGRWVFIGTNYGTGAMLLDAHRIDDSSTAEVVYELTNQFRLKFNDAIYKDGMLYGADDGILSCIDFKTGKRHWKRGRYGYGQLLLVDDVLLVQAESGKVVLVEATPERFNEITSLEAIDGKTWNHPVVHQGRLFVRNSNEAACFDISRKDIRAKSKGNH